MTEQTSDQVEAIGDLPEIDPSARITRVPFPIASPGCCVICGKSEHPLGFAATDNLDFEFYGTVYFCADCIGSYARIFGFISPAELSDLRTQSEVQEAELKTLRLAVLGLESSVDSLAAELARRSSVTSNVNVVQPPVLSVVSYSVGESDAGLTDEDVTESSDVVDELSERDSEQVVSQGPDDVYDTTSADELLGL